MTAFSRIPAEQGIAAMNSINVTIVRSPFMGLFVPTAILCIVIAVLALIDWRGGASFLMLAGAALYVFASFVSTIVFNVPMNDALAKVAKQRAGSGSALDQLCQGLDMVEPCADHRLATGLGGLRAGADDRLRSERGLQESLILRSQEPRRTRRVR